MTSRTKLVLSFATGLAAASGHAPFGLWPLAIVGFSGLIWLVARADRPGRTAWVAGAGYFGLSMHWIVEPFLVDIATHGWMAPFALLFLATGLALFWGGAAWVAGRFFAEPGTRGLAFACLLALAEMLRGHIFTGFPWALPGYIWAETPLRAATAWTGSYGLSALTLFACACLVHPARLRGVVLGAGLLGALFLAGALRMGTPLPSESLGQVRLVQPNVPQNEKWVPEKVPEHFRRFRQLSQGAKEADNAMVVWPEAAIVYPLDRAETFLSAGYASAGVPVVTGINRRSNEGGWHNSMVVAGHLGEVSDVYDKVHLVPFGEYIPFQIEFIRAMAASSGFGFTPGAAVHTIDTPLGRALPLICYEGIFPGQLFRAKDRADYLLLITNDAWFGTFSGPYQHLDQARFRAAEQGLSLVRVANTGISTVIDPLGRIAPGQSIPLGRTGHLDSPVRKGAITFYARTGDWPWPVILLLTLTGLILTERRNAIANRRTTS